MGNKMRKIVSVVTFLVLSINLVIVINSLIVMMADVMDLSHEFLHSKEGLYLSCLLFVSIYISYIIIKKEISTGKLVYFVIVQIFPFFIVFVYFLKQFLCIFYQITNSPKFSLNRARKNDNAPRRNDRTLQQACLPGSYPPVLLFRH